MRNSKKFFPHIIAHRGRVDGGQVGAENSAEALRSALAAGADGVEVDVRASADGVLVLHHNPFHAGRRIEESRYADLDPPICTLEEAIELCVGALLVAELKVVPRVDPTRAIARLAADALVRVPGVVVSSFDPLALDVVRERAPELRRALLGGRFTRLGRLTRSARSLGIDLVHLHGSNLRGVGSVLDPRAGVEVWSWAVEDRSAFETQFRLGIGGVITDRPKVALSVRDGAG